MSHRFAEIAFTPNVQKEQSHYGSRQQYQRLMQQGPENNRFGPNERYFIESRDGIYVSSVSETGWPYVQFRGGARGFLKVIDDQTLGFADFRGNRQYISTGNWKGNDRVALFLMDYPTQSRLKILGRVELVEAAARPDLVEDLSVPGYLAKVERVVLIHLAGFDWNCQQHITPRWTQEEMTEILEPLQKKMAVLEAENKALRERIKNGVDEDQ
jgi:uncharacterized protein